MSEEHIHEHEHEHAHQVGEAQPEILLRPAAR